MRRAKKRNNPKVNLAISAMLAIATIMILIKLGIHIEVSNTVRVVFN